MLIRRSANIRGLRDIRTHAGRVSATGIPYLAYMKISCLEMERARREREKESAKARIKNIDTRLAEIDREKYSTLTGLNEPARVTSREVDQSNKRAPQSTGQTSKFRIRY